MRHRADSNQGEIIEAAEGMGASVLVLSQVGGGAPDLLIGFRGHNLLVEVKSGRGELRREQWEWHDRWRGRVVVVRTVEHIVQVLGELE